MEIMKNAILNTKLFVMVLGAVLVLSCSAEDGQDGQNGAIGPQGVAGIDGIDGQDGLDGNANVINITFDVSEITGDNFNMEVPGLTTEIVENGVVLAYLKSANSWQQIPGTRILLNDVTVYIDVNTYLFSFNGGTSYDFYMEFTQGGSDYSIASGDMETLRVVLIESNSTITSKTNQISALQELKNAGVDTSDYYAVMDHFGLDY